jgi:hypothetical protein
MALKKVTINGVTYETSEVNIPLADNPTEKAKFMETSDGNLVASKMAKGTSGYSKGVQVHGTAEDVGTINETLDASSTTYTVPSGITQGGEVKIITETKTVTPSKSIQKVTPSSGKLLSEVTVNKIPDIYHDVSKVDAVATDIKAGKKVVGPDGTLITGTHTDPTFSLANGILSIA